MPKTVYYTNIKKDREEGKKYQDTLSDAEKKDLHTMVRRVNDELDAHVIDRQIKDLQKEYKEVSEQAKGNSHDASHPDMGYGKEERFWRNHRYISRKRNKNGKWIYDYGYGYGVTKPELDRIKGEIDKKTLEASQLRGEARNPGKWEEQKQDPVYMAGEKVKDIQKDASKAINEGINFIKNFKIKL